MTLRPFPRSTLAQPATTVAPLLLGCLLESNAGGARVLGRIVETEAYTQDDPASHSFHRLTPRNATMFGPAGHLYVYFTYGMHWCANVVTGDDGVGEAVLLRALRLEAGLDVAQARRSSARRGSARVPIRLTDGPAKLCQALAIDGALDGIDLCDAESSVRLLSDGADPYLSRATPRIGISRGQDLVRRFVVR